MKKLPSPLPVLVSCFGSSWQNRSRHYGNHLVRAVYEYREELPVLVTVYFPYVDRYFKGGEIYEDKDTQGKLIFS